MAESEELMTVGVMTPDGLIYSHKSSIVVMRVIDGEKAAMYNHIPFLTPLVIGDVKAKGGKQLNNRVDHITVNSDYTNFSNNVATIIADSAERARNVDLSCAEAVKRCAEQRLREAKASHSESSYEGVSVVLKRAVNRTNIYQGTQ